MGSEEVPVPNLLPRPPTPPREKQPLETTNQRALSDITNPHASSNLNTPPSTHSVISGSGSKASRRVGFSGQTQYFSNADALQRQSTPRSASSTLPPPTKSILKKIVDAEHLPSNPLSFSQENQPPDVDIPKMLESTLKQLAGGDRDSRIDAYRTLQESFRVSNNLPGRIALQDKMTLYTQFLERDLTLAYSIGILDMQLVTNALGLLATFLMFPAIASNISNDFGIFIVEHCIHAFEGSRQPTFTKEIIKRLLHLLDLQAFSSKVMTAERIGRLVAAMHKVDTRFSGKGVRYNRILAYKNLMARSRQHMIVHVDWLGDVFEDMVSNVKEIRLAAIDFGLEAAYSNLKDRQLSNKVHKLMLTTRDDQTFQDYYIKILTNMAKDKGELSPMVPHIWSVMILLLRIPYDKWNTFKRWLAILQLCFNSSNLNTRQQVNIAWSRLVFSCQLQPVSFSKQIQDVLPHPIVTQLGRKASSKAQDELRRHVFGAACMLLYYALKPTLTHSQLEQHWKLAVQPIIKQMISKAGPEGMDQATRVLTALFDSTSQHVWNEYLVKECPLAQPEQIVHLEPKWVRHNSKLVFSLVSPIIKNNLHFLVDTKSWTWKMWKNLVSSIASVANMEIKVSTDTASFLAETLTLLHGICTTGLVGLREQNPEVSEEVFFAAIKTFVREVATSLGSIAFTEKMLSLNVSCDPMLPTQSIRQAKTKGILRTPLQHLFLILSELPPSIPDNIAYADFLRSVLGVFYEAKNTKVRQTLTTELIWLLPTDKPLPCGVWIFVADNVIHGLDAHVQNSQSLSGVKYRDAINFLARGLISSPNLPLNIWKNYFDIVSKELKGSLGQAGQILALVEPLSKNILPAIHETNAACIYSRVLQATVYLLSVASYPQHQQAFDSALRFLWGTDASRGSAIGGKMDNFYSLVDKMASLAYNDFFQINSDQFILPLLKELIQFLSRSSDRVQIVLQKLQHGMSYWIQDEKAQLNSKNEPEVAEAAILLWDTICSILSTHIDAKTIHLDVLGPLFLSAFASQNHHVVNSAALLWNKLADDTDHIEWSDSLKSKLVSLRVSTGLEIVLPGIDPSSIETAEPLRPSFVESQNDLNILDLNEPPPSINLSSKPTVSTPHSFTELAPVKRLRHDESQVHFTAIPSSSPRDVVDSQLLTDRQIEVRNRQRDNLALSDEVHNSPISEASLPTLTDGRAAAAKTATPERQNLRREDRGYISSTPTPRRGHDVLMTDIENDNDPPSSPPEPRRYPLLPNMSNRPRTNTAMPDWEFSSSPTSVSPLQGVRNPSPELDTYPSATFDVPNTILSNSEVEPHLKSKEDGGPCSSTHAPFSTVEESLDVDAMDSEDDPTPKPTQSSPTSLVVEPSPSSEIAFDPVNRIVATKPIKVDDTDGKDLERSRQITSTNITEYDSYEIGERQHAAAHLDSFETNIPGTKLKSLQTADSSEDVLPLISQSISIELESRPVDHLTPYIPDTNSPENLPSPHKIKEYTKLSPTSSTDTKRTPKGVIKEYQSFHRGPITRSSSRRASSQPIAGSPSTPFSNMQSSTRSSAKRKRPCSNVSEGGDFKRQRSLRMVIYTPERHPEEKGGLFSAGKKLWQGITGAFADLSQSATSEQDEDKAVDRSTSPSFGSCEPAGIDSEEITSQDEVEKQLLGDGQPNSSPTTTVQARESKDPVQFSQLRAAEMVVQQLRGSLELLQTATLSRDEVYKIETMFMDIKRELYEAEKRGRELEST